MSRDSHPLFVAKFHETSFTVASPLANVTGEASDKWRTYRQQVCSRRHGELKGKLVSWNLAFCATRIQY